jgi:hypothetical protein
VLERGVEGFFNRLRNSRKAGFRILNIPLYRAGVEPLSLTLML